MTNEAKKLFEEAQSGDRHALRLLTEQNLGLVRKVSDRFFCGEYEKDDLFQIGCLGLIKAVLHFDLHRQTAFSTYAFACILGEIRSAIRDSGAIKISRSRKALAAKIRDAQNTYFMRFGKEPTLLDLAQQLHTTAEEISEALCAGLPLLSLDEPAEEDVASYAPQLFDTEDVAETAVLSEAVRESLTRLPPLERNILILRFYRQKTQSEIAALLSVSQVQVCRLEKKALAALRPYFGAP